MQQRRLSAARTTYEGDDFAGGDCEPNIADNLKPVAVTMMDAACLDESGTSGGDSGPRDRNTHSYVSCVGAAAPTNRLVKAREDALQLASHRNADNEVIQTSISVRAM